MSVQRLSETYRSAFVTGVSSGLGRAFADMLLAEGVQVWGTSRDESRLKDLSPVPGFNAVVMDLDSAAEAEAVFAKAAEQAGGCFDLVIMNAGYGVFAPFASVHFSVWQRQLEAMLITHSRLSHAALVRLLPRKRGCVFMSPPWLRNFRFPT